jgi:hypothetical protein
MTGLDWLPTAAELVAEMDRVVEGAPRRDHPAWVSRVVELVQSNLQQWELEDLTRNPHASDEVVARAKREIDRLNAGRHRLMEQIDATIESGIDQQATAPMATESPGMVLDRLSVLVIRRARTASVSGREPEYAARLPELESRLATLSMAFDSYLEELRAGNRQFLPYEGFKLYGSSASVEG